MFKLDTETEIIAPSDVKISITFVDSDDNPISLSDIYIKMILSDCKGHEYVCIHDPFEPEHNINTEVDDDVLNIILSNYELRGKIYCKGMTRQRENFTTQHYCNCYTNLILADDNNCMCNL